MNSKSWRKMNFRSSRSPTRSAQERTHEQARWVKHQRRSEPEFVQVWKNVSTSASLAESQPKLSIALGVVLHAHRSRLRSSMPAERQVATSPANGVQRQASSTTPVASTHRPRRLARSSDHGHNVSKENRLVTVTYKQKVPNGEISRLTYV